MELFICHCTNINCDWEGDYFEALPEYMINENTPELIAREDRGQGCPKCGWWVSLGDGSKKRTRRMMRDQFRTLFKRVESGELYKIDEVNDFLRKEKDLRK